AKPSIASWTEPLTLRIVPANARSIDDDGPVAMVSFPPGRRVKSTGALFVARLTKTLSVPASVNPSIPTSAAEPLPLSAKKLFVGADAISRISGSGSAEIGRAHV